MAINDPRDIPGLVLWLSAEAETGLADGTAMTSWTNLVSGGGNATAATVGATKPLWQATTGGAGGPSVRFASGGYFTFPDVLAGTGATGAEVMATVKSDIDSGTSQGNWLKYSAQTGTSTYYPQSSGGIYDDWAASSRTASIPPGVTLTAWRRVNIDNSTAGLNYSIDGVLKNNQVSLPYTAPNRTGLLGNSTPSGAPTNLATNVFTGNVGCVVIYSRRLTTTERTDLDTWLQAHPSGGTAAAQTPAVTLAGTAPAVTGMFDATASSPPPGVTLTGIAPAVTGSFAATVATPPASADLSGTAPKVTGSFTVELVGAVTADLTGAAPTVSGSFGITASAPAIEVATDSVNRLNGMTLVTQWHVEINGPITSPTRQPAHDYAVATSLPEPTLVEGRPT